MKMCKKKKKHLTSYFTNNQNGTNTNLLMIGNIVYDTTDIMNYFLANLPLIL